MPENGVPERSVNLAYASLVFFCHFCNSHNEQNCFLMHFSLVFVVQCIQRLISFQRIRLEKENKLSEVDWRNLTSLLAYFC